MSIKPATFEARLARSLAVVTPFVWLGHKTGLCFPLVWLTQAERKKKKNLAGTVLWRCKPSTTNAVPWPLHENASRLPVFLFPRVLILLLSGEPLHSSIHHLLLVVFVDTLAPSMSHIIISLAAIRRRDHGFWTVVIGPLAPLQRRGCFSTVRYKPYVHRNSFYLLGIHSEKFFVAFGLNISLVCEP